MYDNKFHLIPVESSARPPRVRPTLAAPGLHDEWITTYRSNPIQQHFNDSIMHRVLAHMRTGRGTLFLDAGCGTAEHSIRIASRGFRCVGGDVSAYVLQRAQKRTLGAGLASAPHFVCLELEELPFPSGIFDGIHCRGVLMHIPEWERAVAELCRVIRPGGRIAILESNQRSLETAIIRIIRRIKRRPPGGRETAGGVEYWTEVGGSPFVTRVGNVNFLARTLSLHGVRTVARFATEFWDIGRFRPGLSRTLAIRFNQLWFFFRLPALLSKGNALIGEKNA